MVYTYKKLNFLYTVKQTYTAGIMLDGWEVKALDESNGDINDSYCSFMDGIFYLNGTKIVPLYNQAVEPVFAERKRKLLLNKKELLKIQNELKVNGITCIPIKLYRASNYLWKVDIAIVQGKKKWDNRNKIDAKDNRKLNSIY